MDFEITKEMTFGTILLFGFLLGLKHAVEADHLAAVSTIVAERKNVFVSAIVGGFWGIGHTLSLLIVGALVIFLKIKISETVEGYLEAVVGFMLIVLGLNAFRKLSGKQVHWHTHEHNGHEHVHPHTHDENDEANESHHLARLTPRTVIIGMIHGLAGSAGLMLLVVPTIDSAAMALLYIAIFGLGSVGGMMIMSILIGLPIYFTAGKFELLNRGILGLAGVFSLCLGVFIVYEKLIA